MFEKVLDCPKCRKRFHYECDGAIPPRIVCPECHVESPMEEYSAVILCSECRAKLKLPLDMLDTPGIVCPKCGQTLVGDSLNLYDEGASTITLENLPGSDGGSRLLADGELFDKYRIVRLLGRGGMAEVYLAEHLLLQRPCALKLMRRGLTDDPVFIKRFIREAKLANRIDHPNIVRVYDAGSDFKTGLLFLAMEYVEGRTLLEMMHEKLLSEAELREILVAMAGALKTLAELHVIHRDIKPSNIMRTKEGVYKLMDLGIAKSESDHGLGEMTLTVGQAAIGTPAYASPEQCRSAHDVDIRSDIYCLGATLYHLASGKVPFEGETPVAIILKVMQSEAEPLHKLRPDLSLQLVELIERMMKKNPDDRPSSPEELLALATEPVRGWFGDLLWRCRRCIGGFFRPPYFTVGKIAAAAAVLAAVVLVAVLIFFGGGRKSRPARPVPRPTSRSAATVAGKSTNVRNFTAPRPEPAPVPLTLEARIRHVEKRLGELRKGDGDKTESEAQRKFREYQIKLREEQLKRLQAQQKVRERALALRKNPGQYPATREFQEKFARHTRERRDWGYNSRDIEFANELIAMLRSGKVDPNVEVVDSTYPTYSGPLIQAVLSGRIQRSREIVEVLLQLGADTAPIVAKGTAGIDVSSARLVFARGGSDAPPGLLLRFCRKRPFGKEEESLVTELLYLDYNVEERDADGNTPLHSVAAAGAANLITVLVALDGDVNAANNRGETPLFAATLNDRPAAIRQLIALGADSSIRSRDGKTAAEFEVQGHFWSAVKNRSVSVAQEKLKQGAKIDIPDDDGESALSIACRQGDVAMVTMLLAAGANPDIKQTSGRTLTPLQVAVDRKSFNLKIAALLLKYGADPNVSPPGYGGTTLLRELCSWWSPADEARQIELLQLLLANPRTTRIDRNYRGRERSLLSVAVERRRPAAFIEAFAKLVPEIAADDPVLYYAVLNEYPESVLRALIAKKANANVAVDNKTALWIATEKGRSDVMKVLIAGGADPDWRNQQGRSIRDLPPVAARPAAPSAAPAGVPAKPPVVREFSAPKAAEAPAATLEERFRHVTKRLGELRQAPGKEETAAQRKFREYRIKVREEQLKRLREQQRVRETYLARRKQGYYTATKEFQRKFALYTKGIRDPNGNTSINGVRYRFDEKLARELLAMLEKSDRIDPNVEVTDPLFPRKSGPLLHWLMEANFWFIREEEHGKKILEQLVQRGGYIPEISETSWPLYSGSGRFDRRPLLFRGGLDRVSGLLIRDCRSRPLNEKLVTDLLYLDHNVVERDAKGNTALHYVAAAGSTNLVALIVALDGDVNAVNNRGDTPLFSATLNGRSEVVRQLLALGADPSIRNQDGRTAAEIGNLQSSFWGAVRSRSVPAAQEFLKRGADVNMVRDDGETALLIACKQRDVAMVEMLLPAGAEASSAALLLMRKQQHFEPKIIALLLKHGAEPNGALRNLLMSGHSFGSNSTRTNPFMDLTEEQEIEFLRLLLADSRVQSDTTFFGGRSMTSVAVERRRKVPFVMELLKHTKEFASTDPVLVLAIRNDYPEAVIRELIAKKANVNVVLFEGTPLWIAKEKGRTEVVKLLLAHGADPNWRNSNGESVRDVKKTMSTTRVLQPSTKRSRKSTRQGR